MKYFCNLPVISLIVFIAMAISLISCGTPPQQAAAATGTEPIRELVLAPTIAPPAPARPVLSPEEMAVQTITCLMCHGQNLEGLQAITANFVFRGDIVQPHVYLDMTLPENPHLTDKAMDCLLCHDSHAIPLAGPVRVADLNSCIRCHHTGDMVTCFDCHTSIP